MQSSKIKKIENLNEKNEYIIIDMNNRDSIDIMDSITINYNEDGHFYLLTKLYDIYSFLQGDIMFILEYLSLYSFFYALRYLHFSL